MRLSRQHDISWQQTSRDIALINARYLTTPTLLTSTKAKLDGRKVHCLHVLYCTVPPRTVTDGKPGRPPTKRQDIKTFTDTTKCHQHATAIEKCGAILMSYTRNRCTASVFPFESEVHAGSTSGRGRRAFTCQPRAEVVAARFRYRTASTRRRKERGRGGGEGVISHRGRSEAGRSSRIPQAPESSTALKIYESREERDRHHPGMMTCSTPSPSAEKQRKQLCGLMEACEARPLGQAWMQPDEIPRPVK
jgi:hypothetical protein